MRDLVGKACGSHLAAGHAVDGVIDEDNGDVLAARSRMNGFRHSDAGEVAVALISKNDIAGINTFDTRCNRRCTTVGGFNHVATKEIVCHDRATNGHDANRGALDIKLVDAFGNQAHNDTVSAARAEIGHDGQQGMRALENDIAGFIRHVTHPPFH